MKYTHLIYVEQYSIVTNNYELFVYGTNTDDIFHTTGEIMYRSETQVKSIYFVELTQENIQSKLNFWQKENKTIHTWIDKYY